MRKLITSLMGGKPTSAAVALGNGPSSQAARLANRAPTPKPVAKASGSHLGLVKPAGAGTAGPGPEKRSGEQVAQSPKVYRSMEDLPAHKSIASADGGMFVIAPQIRQVLCILELESRRSADEQPAFCILATSDIFGSAHFTSAVQRIEKAGYKCRYNGIADAGLLNRLSQGAGVGVDDGEIDTAIKTAVNDLFRDAKERGASDVHIEGRADRSRVRMRIDGQLRDITDSWSLDHVSRLARAMYGMAETPKPSLYSEDCNFTVKNNDLGLQARVELAAVFQGALDITFRLQRLEQYSASKATDSLATLGFHENQIDEIDDMLAKPTSLMLTLGITGAGKTRTLYTTFGSAQRESVVNGHSTKKFITVESPVEAPLEGVTQLTTDAEDSEAYAAVLLKVLRMDPDYLMMGEIRDSKAAKLLEQFVLSGHKAFGSFHAPDGPTALKRLNRLGIPLDVLADRSFMAGTISQDLLPTLCPHCKEEYRPSDSRISSKLHERIAKMTTGADTLYVASTGGCEACGSTGIIGRTVCAETMTMDDDMREAVEQGDFKRLRSLWRAQKAKGDGPLPRGSTKLDHALLKMRQGLVSPKDVEAVLGPLTAEVDQ